MLVDGAYGRVGTEWGLVQPRFPVASTSWTVTSVEGWLYILLERLGVSSCSKL